MVRPLHMVSGGFSALLAPRTPPFASPPFPFPPFTQTGFAPSGQLALTPPPVEAGAYPWDAP